jgi:hypothetical protein
VKAVKLATLLFAVLAAQVSLSAADKTADKAKEKAGAKVADSGSFGIYVNGKRVGTETFNITETLNSQQLLDYSTATSEIKFDDGRFKATQTAEMQVSAKGELRSYVWRATVPQKEEASVMPKDQLLVEHIIPADQKKLDVQHVLPLSTVILDDNFFSQREILLWWYLANCRRQGDALLCDARKFVILVPHQHVSGNATLELMGQEKIMVKGAERELNKVKLDTNGPQSLTWLNDQSRESEAAQWVLWVDDQYRVIKMTVAGSNVEVIRD